MKKAQVITLTVFSIIVIRCYF